MHACRVSAGLFLCVVIGCQDSAKQAQDANTVSGKVYLGEQLVNYGVASFIGENDKTLKSVIYADGTYNIRNPPKGEYRIIIVTGSTPLAAGGGGSSKEPPPVLKKITIPGKYSSSETTDLKYQVNEGRHTYDIKMEPGK